jgi:trehalose/maltose hydrolase-like predicted phosphorylase
MLVPFHDDVISQFEGYETLDEFDWEGYRAKYGNIARLDRILKAEGDSPDHYRASKQADVLMLFYVLSVDEIRRIFAGLGYTLDDKAVRRTIDYYLKRTSHGSTLSQVVHSAVLARIDPPLSWRLFSSALRSDVADVQGGTTPEGVHLGLMSATLDVVLQQHAGVDTSGDCLRVAPCLPEAWRSVRFRLRHQGRWYQLSVGKEHCQLDLDQDHLDSVEVEVEGERVRIEPGSSYEWSPAAVAKT